MKIWKSTLYRSRWSKVVEGYLCIEGENRSEAKELLKRLAAAPTWSSARSHAREAMEGGERRHTLVLEKAQVPYAAKDGKWRGWGMDAWKADPPAAYSSWAD